MIDQAEGLTWPDWSELRRMFGPVHLKCATAEV